MIRRELRTETQGRHPLGAGEGDVCRRGEKHSDKPDAGVRPEIQREEIGGLPTSKFMGTERVKTQRGRGQAQVKRNQMFSRHRIAPLTSSGGDLCSCTPTHSPLSCHAPALGLACFRACADAPINVVTTMVRRIPNLTTTNLAAADALPSGPYRAPPLACAGGRRLFEKACGKFRRVAGRCHLGEGRWMCRVGEGEYGARLPPACCLRSCPLPCPAAVLFTPHLNSLVL